MKKPSEDKYNGHALHGGNEKQKTQPALAKKLQRKVTHPYWGSVEYQRCLNNLQAGPAASKPESGQWPPCRWAKVLFLLLSLLATLWVGWEARALATSTFTAHLQAVWRELNEN